MAANVPMMLISIEGNIGVGKSTVLSRVRDAYAGDPRVVVVDEPAELWERHGLLQAVYDKRLSATVFQQVAIASRVGAIGRATRDGGVRVVISERSPFSDKHVFAKSNVRGIDETAYELSFDDVVSLLPPFSKRRFIVLRANVDTIVSRIAGRSREAERGIERSYLQVIDDAHVEFAELFADETVLVDAEDDKGCVVEGVLAEVRAVLEGA